MDRPGFELYLQSRQASALLIEQATQLVDEFEQYIGPCDPGEETLREEIGGFSRRLIQTGRNTEENYLALLRYGFFSQNMVFFIAVMELLDGEEAMRNLYQRLGDRFGGEVQEYVFQDFGVPALGTPTTEKPIYTRAVLDRLDQRLEPDAITALLKECLRDLPEAMYADIRRQYQDAKDIDDFLQKQGDAFLAQMESLSEQGKPFFSQPVTAETLAYLRQHPEISHGERAGNVIYEVKIPFQTDRVLHSGDAIERKYYTCHCPWARESLRNPEKTVPASFCNCSAGFHKRKWELIFEQPLQVEVVESILQGDERCRFAIYLPIATE